MKKKLSTLILTAALMLAARPAKAILAGHYWLTNGPSGVPSMPYNPFLSQPTVETNSTLHDYVIMPATAHQTAWLSNAVYYFWGQQSFGTNGGLLYTNLAEWENPPDGQTPDTNQPPPLITKNEDSWGGIITGHEPGYWVIGLSAPRAKPDLASVTNHNGICWGTTDHKGIPIGASDDPYGTGLNPSFLDYDGRHFAAEPGTSAIYYCNGSISDTWRSGGFWFEAGVQFPDYVAAAGSDVPALVVRIYYQGCDLLKTFNETYTMKLPHGHTTGTWSFMFSPWDSSSTNSLPNLEYCDGAGDWIPKTFPWGKLVMISSNTFAPSSDPSSWCSGTSVTNIWGKWWADAYPTNGPYVGTADMDDGSLKTTVFSLGTVTNWTVQTATNLAASPVQWVNEGSLSLGADGAGAAAVSVAGRTNLFVRARQGTNGP